MVRRLGFAIVPRGTMGARGCARGVGGDEAIVDVGNGDSELTGGVGGRVRGLDEATGWLRAACEMERVIGIE